MGTEPDFGKLVDELNAGAPIPAVAPEDLRAALSLFSEARNGLRKAGAYKEGEVGCMYEDLAARCSTGADVISVFIRGLLLEAAFARIGGDKDEVLITRTLAEMPITGHDLGTPNEIVERVQKLITGHQK